MLLYQLAVSKSDTEYDCERLTQKIHITNFTGEHQSA